MHRDTCAYTYAHAYINYLIHDYFIPALGLIFQPLGKDGVEWPAIKLYFNLYTGPGFLGALLGVINIVMVVFFFKEYNLHGVKKKLHLSRLLYYCMHGRKDDDSKPLIERKLNGKFSNHQTESPLCFLTFYDPTL